MQGASIMTEKPFPTGAIGDLLAGDDPGLGEIGGEAFLEDLLRTEGPVVKSVLMQKFSGALSGADIDDVLAVALNRVWVKRAGFDVARGSLRAWFFRIAHNCAVDVLKHGWHRARQLEVPASHDFIAELPGKATEPETPEPEPAQAEIYRVVRELIAALPETQRRIIWADAQHEHGPTPSKDLARELDIPLGTVRVYRKRALDRLRRELEKRQLDPDSIQAE